MTTSGPAATAEIAAHAPSPEGLRQVSAGDSDVPSEAIWLDILNIGADVREHAERWLGAEIPSRDELAEIEFSSRVYSEDGTYYLTADVLAHADTPNPILSPVSFILRGNRLVTVRSETPKAIPQFLARAARPDHCPHSGTETLIGLLEAIVDRTADVLERQSAHIDRLSKEIFTRRKDVRRRSRRLAVAVESIGEEADLLAKIRESLVSQERLVYFASSAFVAGKGEKSLKDRAKLLSRDIQSLETHAEFLSNKTTFLLNATLGLISVEQNGVVRMLTVVATAFFPPTLIGTIYGMNFEAMPELTWSFGYPLALAAMLLSAVVPFIWFRWKGWI